MAFKTLKNGVSLLTLGFVLALALPTVSCAQVAADEGKKPKVTNETYEMLNLFGDVFERVRDSYVEEVPDKKLVESALNGMLSALDPHSGYLDAASFDDMKVQTTGEFGGLGIEVTMENGLVKVVAPYDDTPAAKAGLKSGDYVIKIDGQDVMGLSLSDAVGKMKGKVGSDVTLTIVRQDRSEPFDVKMTRDTIKVKSVRYRLQGDDVGYIRITSFNEQVEENLAKAIKDLKDKAKGNIKGYVLDLRNNPGGLLDQAIYVSDAFLEKGEIVSTRGRHAEDTKRVNATPGDLADHMPLVVLINEGSASASEIVAGALQDHHRAILMGTKSFGKGSVQTIIALPGNGAMRLTTARYYTPSGRSIQAQGIVPDIEVKPAKIEEVVDKLAKYMTKEADLPGALKNDTLKKAIDEQQKKINKDQATPGAEGEGDAQDYQLQRANDLIRGIARYESQDGTKVDMGNDDKLVDKNVAAKAEKDKADADVKAKAKAATEAEPKK